MGYSLDDVFAKLDGANERLDKLIESIHRGAVTDLLKVGTNRDPKGRVIVRIEDLAEIPKEWHVWIGECIHDLRSAIDHVAYGVNVVGAGADPPPNWGKSQFPLYGNPGRFKAMLAADADRSMAGFFPLDARTVAESMQPYRAGDGSDLADTAQWLGVLAELSNIDKHRRFPITAVFPDLISYPKDVEGHAVANVQTWHRPLKPGTDLMRLVVPTLPASVKEPQVHFAYMGGLNFQGKEAQPPLPLVLEQEPVNFVLPQILKTVRDSVIPAFTPFLE